MSTYMPVFQSFPRFFASFLLAKSASSSIRVKAPFILLLVNFVFLCCSDIYEASGFGPQIQEAMYS